MGVSIRTKLLDQELAMFHANQAAERFARVCPENHGLANQRVVAQLDIDQSLSRALAVACETRYPVSPASRSWRSASVPTSPPTSPSGRARPTLCRLALPVRGLSLGRPRVQSRHRRLRLPVVRAKHASGRGSWRTQSPRPGSDQRLLLLRRPPARSELQALVRIYLRPPFPDSPSRQQTSGLLD